MTNSEYFEKNKISFAKAMEIFNKQKDKGIKSFDEFLASEHVESKFKTGDLVVLQLNAETRLIWKHNVVFEIIAFIPGGGPDGDGPAYELMYLTPDGGYKIGCINYALSCYIDKHCILY